ncbi:PAS domain S-box-containing protein/diguanylate cyclase (GGDEF)-like protein [Pseudoduganella flava]|uniref:Diguanylate cyclase n=1 Tax=Pseudoduganella flava TaxID=871742 RepID=A0A562PKE6_9BURK|nr:sensor domain-containing diguanylate cyclase [Pseudoduganella flava]QGZ42332.1 diguanylate cyclase [Pseudoduganella flava]TWI44887.1 PAS domain S-box-containing protein/diguanylate cyclase (GGDEF)-like protein [Pseudoduganella flava]
MNTVPSSHLSAVWTTDGVGRCLSVLASIDGLLPPMCGVALPAWIDAVRADATCSGAVAEAIGAAWPFHAELPLRCLDGATRHVVISGIPHAGGYSGMLVDVTTQHAALERARRAAAEHVLLVENSSDLIAHCGPDGRYVAISPSYTAMMGWERSDMIGRLVTEFLHPDDQAPAHDALLRIFAGAVLPDVVEVRKRHRDGHYIAVGTNARGVTDPATGANRGAVLVSRDITRDKETIRKLELRVTRDALTGLPNRTWINERVQAMLAQASGAAQATVLFIDLNGFKAVNDTLGHAAGDELLRQVGKRLQACMRPGDAVGRLGGDEFVVAAACSDRSAAAAIAQRLLDALKAPFAVGETDVRVGAAIGISLHRAGPTTAAALLEQADSAMYAAKRLGDGGYRFFES